MLTSSHRAMPGAISLDRKPMVHVKGSPKHIPEETAHPPPPPPRDRASEKQNAGHIAR